MQPVFGCPAGEKYVSKLCEELVGLGRCIPVLVNAFGNKAYRRIGKAIKKTKGALIYRR